MKARKDKARREKAKNSGEDVALAAAEPETQKKPIPDTIKTFVSARTLGKRNSTARHAMPRHCTATPRHGTQTKAVTS